MVDKRITELTPLTGANLADSDEFPVVDASASETKSITKAELVTALGQSFVSQADASLDAIAATIAKTAVDVFVYNPAYDSDGGAWTERTQNTSWYRVSGKHPAATVAILEAGTLTIYDATDTSLPVWRTEDLSAFTCNALTAKDGKYLVATTTGLIVLDYVTDDIDAALAYSTSTTPAIVNNAANDVAITVLDNAQIDATTGLPVSTRPVGTNGGLSVIADDGNVYDSSKTTPVVSVDIQADKTCTAVFSDGVAINYDLTAITADGFTGTTVSGILGTPTSNTDGAFGSTGGVTIEDPSGLIAFVASDYNTGMVGDIEGAFLSSTDTSSLTDTTLVPNGTFDTNIDGWLDLVNNTSTFSSGQLSSVSTAVATGSYTTFATVVGKSYTVSADRISGTANSLLRVGDGSVPDAGIVSSPEGSAAETLTVQFTAESTTSYIYLRNSIAGTTVWDNVIATLDDEDRSVNANPLTVNGTITRAPVATGAELVWYTFSADCTVTLDTDISASGMVTWWEDVSGVATRYDKDLSGGQDYVNGIAGTAPTTSITFSGADMTFKAGKTMALERPSATISTAAQVKAAYEAEKYMFQENAACTLFGTSDAVTALAHDPVTDLLHVGTSAGRSDFQGLVRVSNTTNAVGAAISAVNGLIADE